MLLAKPTSPPIGGRLLPSRYIGLIVDNLQITKWQADALLHIADMGEFVVLNCTNTRSRRQLWKHSCYYALNLLCLKSRLTAKAGLPSALSVRHVLDFQSKYDGDWQKLTPVVINQINALQPACLIKFGMGLLRVPRDISCPILSYHHGDPRKFRGRPAGFYELLSGEPTVGQVVQILSEHLDAGKVVAFAESRVHRHSYRKTMLEAFGRSPLLLAKAVQKCLSGEIVSIEGCGKNYRLPSNRQVMRFASRVTTEKVRRLFYGLLVEKHWQAAEAPMTQTSIPKLLSNFPPQNEWTVFRCPPRYRFLADPFPHPDSGALLEALRSSDYQGEILHIDGKVARVLCTDKGHFSYPGISRVGGQSWILPETSEWTSPVIYRLTGEGVDAAAKLVIEQRLLDPTLYINGNTVYLFGNDASEGPSVLRLWIADNLFSKFAEHPASPIRISPSGSRMAGAILQDGPNLYRVGQDWAREYGSGVVLFLIERLSRSEYMETEIAKFSFQNRLGPHTLNVGREAVLFDFYAERITPLAGFRRLRGMISKRRANQSN